MQRPSPTHAHELSMLPRYAKEMAHSHPSLPSNMRVQHGPTAVAWNFAFWKATASNHMHTANSLRHMAGAKAKKIEGANLALNTSKWKAAIGASNSKGKGPRPCRLAYRWVKGIEGWTASTGSEHLE